MPLRAAVIGAGWGGELHLEGFRRCPEVQVVALCSRTGSHCEAVAGRFAVAAVYTDYREMLEREDLDIVTIATPPPLHHEMTMAAIARGCSVLCDKPLAMTAAQGREMVATAEARGIRHATGFIWRNDPAILQLRALLQQGVIGAVRDLHSRCAMGTPVLPLTWLYEREAGGGALMQHGSHVIDRARWVLGDEISQVWGEPLYELTEAPRGPRFHNVSEAFLWGAGVTAQPGEPLPTGPVTADTGYTLHARFAGGARGYFWESWHSHGSPRDCVEVHGTAGTLLWTNTEGLVLLRPGRPPESLAPAASGTGAGEAREVGHALWARLLQAFVSDILGRAHEPYPTLRDGYMVQRVIEAGHESARTGTWAAC